jgi:hypothetical protein
LSEEDAVQIGAYTTFFGLRHLSFNKVIVVKLSAMSISTLFIHLRSLNLALYRIVSSNLLWSDDVHLEYVVAPFFEWSQFSEDHSVSLLSTHDQSGYRGCRDSEVDGRLIAFRAVSKVKDNCLCLMLIEVLHCED